VGRKLKATSDPSCLRDSDAAIAVLGTLVDEYLNPTVTDLYRSIDEVIARMPEVRVALSSTVYPASLFSTNRSQLPALATPFCWLILYPVPKSVVSGVGFPANPYCVQPP
jgi:UDP-N-acetyl-D-mannosaminuronate dehydrogenase